MTRLLTAADLTSYQVVAGTKVVTDRKSIRIGDAVEHNDQTDDVPLKPGDVLTVHQLTGWNDIGASINVEGEIAHPGTYGFEQGERLEFHPAARWRFSRRRAIPQARCLSAKKFVSSRRRVANNSFARSKPAQPPRA